MAKLLPTGIDGLDAILNGGIPQGHCVLLAGSCGTGKTVLTQQFLFEGAKNGENGIYLSLVEPKEKLVRNMKSFSFFDDSVMESGKVKLVDVTQDVRLRGMEMSNVEGLIGVIKKVVEENNAKRIVIDSITALCEGLEDDDKIRNFIFELNFLLSYLECTSILISEIPPQTFRYSIFGVEEFIADGVILLTEFERKGDLIRALQVIKMRGVSHSRNKQVLEILDDGVTLIPLFKAGID